jgi:hypothetical protein
MRKLSRFSGLFAATLLALASAYADVPHLISYQGRATGTDGQPINGPCTIKFKIYGSESGSDSLWWSGTQTVTVVNGLLNYELGTHGEVPASVFADGDSKWLGVTVGTDPELQPRTQLIAVPYAYHAQSADTAAFALSGAGSGGAWIDAGTNVYPANPGDSVGIGTIDPHAPLEVVAAGHAIVGHSTGSGQVAGVIGGNDQNGFGVLGSTNTGRGVYGMAFDGFGGYFSGDKNYFSQNLGIGTENPGEMLHVYEGNAGDSAYVEIQSGHATSYGETGVRFRNPTGSWRLFMDDFTHDQMGAGDLGLFWDDDSLPAISFSQINNVGMGGDAGSSYRLTVHGDYSGIRAYAGAGSAVHGSAETGWGAYFEGPKHYFSDKTGFGTIHPTHTVTVKGDLALMFASDTKYHLNYYNGGFNLSETEVADYRLFVEDGGNVGIGTGAPTTRLYVNGSFHANSFESNAIGKANIRDEVGLARAPSDVYEQDLSTITHSYLSRELTVPTAGWILAIGSAFIQLGHGVTYLSRVTLGFSDNESSIDGVPARIFLSSDVNAGTYGFMVPCQHLFYVSAGGTYTYYMTAYREYNGATISREKMDLLFIPTGYSSSSGASETPDGELNAETGSVGSEGSAAPQSSVDDLTAIADRIENLTAELADLKAQLEKVQNK